MAAVTNEAALFHLQGAAGNSPAKASGGKPGVQDSTQGGENGETNYRPQLLTHGPFSFQPCLSRSRQRQD